MCCGETETFDLPPEVIEAIAGYRRLLAEHGADWGDERVDFSRWAGFPELARVFETFAETGRLGRCGPVGARRWRAGRGDPRRRRDGVTAGPLRPALAGTPVTVHDRDGLRRGRRHPRPSRSTPPIPRSRSAGAGCPPSARSPRPVCASPRRSACAGRSPTAAARRGSRRASRGSGTTTGGRSSTVTTSPCRCRPAS